MYSMFSYRYYCSFMDGSWNVRELYQYSRDEGRILE